VTCTYIIVINSASTGKLVHQTTKNTSHLIILAIKRKKEKGKEKVDQNLNKKNAKFDRET
jgi:hypothetical protein